MKYFKLLLVVLFLSFTVILSARDKTVETSKYCKIENNKLVEYLGPEKIVKIPNGVSIIEADVFSDNEYIEEVILPNSIVSIGDGAFRNCINLKKINLLDNISYIGAECFYGCSSLENVNIPKSLNSIEEKCFYECSNLKNIDIHNVKIVKNYAFARCYNVLNITLNKIEKLEEYAFACFEDNPNKALKKLSIPGSVEVICECAFQYYSNIEELTIENGVKKIEKCAFQNIESTANRSLKKLVIPGSVEVIGVNAFSCYSNIEELIIENGVKKIETGAFQNVVATVNKSLKKLSIPGSVEVIGEYAFQYYSNIENLIIENGVKKIEDGAFENLEETANKSLKKLVIPGSVEVIGMGAFQFYPNIEELIIEKGVKRIGVGAFVNSEVAPNKSLKKLVIPNSVEIIGELAFCSYPNIEELIIENGVKKIDECAFACIEDNPNKSLKKLVIPGSVEVIGVSAFSCYSNIEELIIENGVKKIEEGAFVNSEEISNKSLKKLKIPGSVEVIGEAAFESFCSNIEELIIEKGVKEIGKNAFACFEDNPNKSLKKLLIPGSVEVIGEWAFEDYSNIEELIIEKGVKRIEKGAFYNSIFTVNKSLKKLVIPGSVEVIGEIAFQCYSNIEELVIEDGVKTIEGAAFINLEKTANKSLKKLVIPGSVETIGDYAFQFWKGLREVSLLRKAQVDKDAFANCPNVKINYRD